MGSSSWGLLFLCNHVSHYPEAAGSARQQTGQLQHQLRSITFGDRSCTVRAYYARKECFQQGTCNDSIKLENWDCHLAILGSLCHWSNLQTKVWLQRLRWLVVIFKGKLRCWYTTEPRTVPGNQGFSCSLQWPNKHRTAEDPDSLRMKIWVILQVMNFDKLRWWLKEKGTRTVRGKRKL